MSPFTESKHPPAHPPIRSALHSSSCLRQLLINVSAITPRGMISRGARDWRESLVHAPLLFMNGSKTGVDSGSLCVAQWPVTATTDIQSLRDGADIEEEAVRGGLREEQ